MPVIDIPQVFLKMGDRTHEESFLSELRPNDITFHPDKVPYYGMLIYWPKSLGWLGVEVSSQPPNGVAPKWLPVTDPNFDAEVFARAGITKEVLTRSAPDFFNINQVRGAHIRHGSRISLRLTVRTDKNSLAEFVRERSAQAGATPGAIAPIQIKALAFHAVGGTAKYDRWEIDLKISPLTPLHAFAGHVALDLGNFSSGMAVLRTGRVKSTDIRTLDFHSPEARLVPNGQTMESVVRIDMIRSWHKGDGPHRPSSRMFPDPERFPHDDSSEAIDWVTGQAATDGDMSGQLAGAKRLLAGPNPEQTRTLVLPHRRNDFPTRGRVTQQGEPIDIRLRLPGELLACRLIQSLMKSTEPNQQPMIPAGWPLSLAVTYPTSYSPREIEQLRSAIHRGWLRAMSYLQRTPEAPKLAPPPPPPPGSASKAVNVPSVGGPVTPAPMPGVAPVAELPQERHASKLQARLGRLSSRQGNAANWQDPIIRLMIDEATAASFYYLFRFSAEAPGGLDAFRYKYPRGMNILLYDCGGGTTDISLVQGRVDAATQNRLTVRVLGRSGVRTFGGDDITAAVCRVFKAKLARLVAEYAGQDAEGISLPNQPPGDSVGKKLASGAGLMKTFLDQTPQSGPMGEYVPTTFSPGDYGQATASARAAANRLWGLGEKLKKLFTEATADKPGVSVVSLGMVEGETLTPHRGGLDAAIFQHVPQGRWTAFSEAVMELQVRRWEVDSLIAAQVVRSLACCRNLIEHKLPGAVDANTAPVVHRVVVTGNAARYPLIPEMLRGELGISDLPPADWFHLDDKELKSAVAKGAVRALAAISGEPQTKFQFDTLLSERLPYTIAYKNWQKGDFIPLYELQDPYAEMTEKEIPIEAVQQSDSGGSEQQTFTLFRRFPGDGDDLPDEYENMPAFDAEDEIQTIRADRGYSPFESYRFPKGVSTNLKVNYSTTEHRFLVEDVNGQRGEVYIPPELDLKTLPPYQRGNL
ncbi:Hsp70 family protein [Zavarzinella formosa]|uniref:hypothetical protein n=1 Tax=Zavarzinella formosa TaxID=360055 RepID=UPI0002EE0843|nr:hypothetical protein [Zavarzinella formosa]